jgi:hypothetical protein
MNAPIFQNGSPLKAAQFIDIKLFYYEGKWVEASKLQPPSYLDDYYLLHHLINNLNHEGTVKHLTPLYDANGQSMIEFTYSSGNQKKTILARGLWNKGFTRNNQLVSIDKDGEIIKPNFTKIEYVVKSIKYAVNSEGLTIPKFIPYKQDDRSILLVDYCGKSQNYDSFMVKYSEGTSDLCLGFLNDAIYQKN